MLRRLYSRSSYVAKGRSVEIVSIRLAFGFESLTVFIGCGPGMHGVMVKYILSIVYLSDVTMSGAPILWDIIIHQDWSLSTWLVPYSCFPSSEAWGFD